MTNELTQDIIDEVLINNPTRAFKDIHRAYYLCKARLEGRTYKDIGKELHISPSRVRDYVVRTVVIYRQRKRKEQLREHHKMTNYEKIKNMSIEEMAECSIPFFTCPYDTPYVGCAMGKKFDDDCIKCTKAWLESEVEE